MSLPPSGPESHPVAHPGAQHGEERSQAAFSSQTSDLDGGVRNLGLAGHSPLPTTRSPCGGTSIATSCSLSELDRTVFRNTVR